MKINEKGMTLIEIMIVIAILGGLMAILVPNVLDNYTKARVRESVIQFSNIKSALRNYMIDCGSFPGTEAGLEALVNESGSGCKNWGPRPYLDPRQLQDQFGHKFTYEFDGSTATITFLGKNGREGGVKYDADVSEQESVD
jgi:general secretion pathway protein G